MTSLHTIQSLFYDAVFDRKKDSSALSEISKYINATPGLNAQDHFNIYRDSIIATLNRALQEIYPVCCRLVGEKFFNGMGTEYMRSHPSCSADLAEYGGDFAEFISGFKHASELHYLVGVARLEWAWHRAFHAADESGLDLVALDEVSETDKPHIVFYLPVSASLIASEFPIQHIWQVNQSDFEGDDRVDLDEGGIKLLIWRQDYTMRIDPMDDVEWSILKQIETGHSFDSLCTILSGNKPIADIENILPVLVQRGWIASFSIDD